MSSVKSKPFLNRPFWRNYIIGAMGIGFGFMLNDAIAPIDSRGKQVLAVIAGLLMILGLMIFLCAIGWSLLWTIRGRRKTASQDNCN